MVDGPLLKFRHDDRVEFQALGAHVVHDPDAGFREVDLGPPGPNARFRFDSPLFTITFAPNNGFGVPAGTGSAVADGYWVLVKPLAVGKHTINFRGKAVFPDSKFKVGVHYNLTVR